MLPEDESRSATIGLGGNIGDVPKALGEALARLGAVDGIRVAAVSALYRTPPWGKTDQAFFFNAAARLDTRLPAEDLLDQCLSIERSMKRERIERWGPRTIDLDLLTYEGEERTGERLTLPHPRMTERGFVLLPLADIAPGLLVRGRTVADWAANAETAGIERIDARPDWWKRDDA